MQRNNSYSICSVSFRPRCCFCKSYNSEKVSSCVIFIDDSLSLGSLLISKTLYSLIGQHICPSS